MKPREALDQVGLLRSLPPAARERVERGSRLRTLGRNETLWRTGEATRSFHFVVDGRIKLRHTMESGRELTLQMVGPGGLACGPAVCSAGCYCCEAASTEGDTRVLSVPKQELFDALFGTTPAARQFVEVLAGRCLSMCDRFVEVSGRAVDQRVAALFVRLAQEQGARAGEDGRVHLPLVLTRRDIAQLCATTEETISRTMVPLERAELVVRSQDGFAIDLEALRQRLADHS